jgi:hypothetical protein
MPDGIEVPSSEQVTRPLPRPGHHVESGAALFT